MKIQKHVGIAYFVEQDDAAPYESDAQFIVDNDQEEEFLDALAFVFDEVGQQELQNLTLRAKDRYESARNLGVRNAAFITRGYLLVYIESYLAVYPVPIQQYLAFEASGFSTDYYNSNIRILPLPLPFGAS